LEGRRSLPPERLMDVPSGDDNRDPRAVAPEFPLDLLECDDRDDSGPFVGDDDDGADKEDAPNLSLLSLGG